MLKKLAPLVWLLIIGTLFRLAISRSIYSGDLNNHVGWGASIIRSGFGGAYDREYTGIMQPTYPPVALYAFSTSVGFYDWLNDAIRQLNKQFSVFPSGLVWWFEDQNTAPAFTKVIAIVSDVGVATLLYIFARRFKASATIAWWVAALYF